MMVPDAGGGEGTGRGVQSSPECLLSLACCILMAVVGEGPQLDRQSNCLVK